MKQTAALAMAALLTLVLCTAAPALNFRDTKQLADQGFSDAQYNLGLMYYRGEGIEKDLVEAARWYEKAAQQGNVRSQINLGIMYYKGEGVPQDKKKAAEWFGKAAEQGYAEAQYGLGNLYYYGDGVPENRSEALIWYRKAAAQGHKQAIETLERIKNAAPPEEQAPPGSPDKPEPDAQPPAQ